MWDTEDCEIEQAALTVVTGTRSCMVSAGTSSRSP